MAARETNTILCPVCRQGRNGGSLLMPKHPITPWERCPGSGQQGSLPDEVEHFIRFQKFTLVSTPTGTQAMWRWVCNCRQEGALNLDEDMSWGHGFQHVKAMERRDGKRGGTPGRTTAGA
jgi:hypothetical protein